MPKKLAGKVALIILVYALPLSALAVYFLITGLNDKIGFARKELAGNRYLRPLVRILAVGGDYRGSLGVSGNEARLIKLREEMRSTLATLKAVDASEGMLLQFTSEGLGSRGRQNARADKLTERWELLESGESGDWAGFEEQVRVMITHAGDTSNLILDPDLDSYYLMDATLLALPTNLSRINEVEQLLLALPAGSEIEKADLVNLAVLATMLRRDDLDRVNSDIETALNEDRNFSGESPTLSAAIKPVLKIYNTSLTNAIKAASMQGSSYPASAREELLLATRSARLAGHHLWETAVAELDTLLNLRIDEFRASRTMALATATAILFASSLLSWLILRTLTRPINEMVAMMQEIAQGEADLRKRLKADGGGELGQLAASFNQFVERLQSLASGTAAVTTHLSQVTREVEVYSRQVNKGAGNQAALLQESGASLSAIGHAARDIDTNAKNLSEVVESSTLTAENLTHISQDMAGQSTRLTATAAALTEETGMLAATSSQISLASLELSTKAEELAASMGQIVLSIQQVRQGADITSQLSQKVSSDVAEGIGAVEATIQGIAELKVQTDASTTIISGLKERTESIDLVLNFISELNDQTSLLALNANIIAAQAGEKGHGFAIIANEVRALSARTAQSAKEIEQMTRGIRKGARDAAMAMEVATARMETEVERANLAGTTLKKIGISANSSLEQAKQIVLVTKEQAQGTARLTIVAEETTDLVNKVARAIGEQDKGVRTLNALAGELRDIVTQVDDSMARQVEQINRVAKGSERIQEMSTPIETKTREQNLRTAALLDAIDRIMAEAEKNAELTSGLGVAVESMSRKADLLNVEMGRFRV